MKVFYQNEANKEIYEASPKIDYKKLLYGWIPNKLYELYEKCQKNEEYKEFYKGLEYEYGLNGKKKNTKLAFDIYKKSADNSPNYLSMYRLHQIYLYYDTKLCYETDPGERIADIKACKYIVNLLKNQNNTDELLIARGMLYYAYTRGYKDNGYYLDPPTYDFLLKTGMYREHYWLKNRVNAKDYCFDTRITYGLPVTYTEYKRGISEKTKVLKKEDFNL